MGVLGGLARVLASDKKNAVSSIDSTTPRPQAQKQKQKHVKPSCLLDRINNIQHEEGNQGPRAATVQVAQLNFSPREPCSGGNPCHPSCGTSPLAHGTCA